MRLARYVYFEDSNATEDLRASDLFKGLDIKQLQLCGKHFTEQTFEARELVFVQGGLAENLSILLLRSP